MVNLLPQEAQQKLHREYKLRFFALLTLLSSLGFLIGVVALLPRVSSVVSSYLAARHAAQQPVAPISAEDNKILASFKAFGNELIAVDPANATSTALVSEAIRLTIQEKPRDLSLTSFSFSILGKTRLLTLSGIAASREGLVSFSKQLTVQTAFSNVDLPISNLSKKSNIDFSITLTLRPK